MCDVCVQKEQGEGERRHILEQCVMCVQKEQGERSHILEQCVMCVYRKSRGGREESHTRTVSDVCRKSRERGVTY